MLSYVKLQRHSLHLAVLFNENVNVALRVNEENYQLEKTITGHVSS